MKIKNVEQREQTRDNAIKNQYGRETEPKKFERRIHSLYIRNDGAPVYGVQQIAFVPFILRLSGF